MKLLTLIIIAIILVTELKQPDNLTNSDYIEELEVIQPVDECVELQDEQEVQEYKKILESADDSTYGGYYRGGNQSDIVVNILPMNLYIPILDNPHISYNEVSYSLTYLKCQMEILDQHSDELYINGIGVSIPKNCVEIWIDEKYMTDETVIREKLNNIQGVDSNAIKIVFMGAFELY